MNEFYKKDIISIKDYDKEKLEKVFVSTDKIMNLDPSTRREICKGKTLGYLFYEPSTRTRLSFPDERYAKERHLDICFMNQVPERV